MNQVDSIAVFAIATTLVMSLLYFFLLERMKQSAPTFIPSLSVNLFLIRKISGFLLFGVIPAVALLGFFTGEPYAFGLQWGDFTGLWVWIAGASFILIALNVVNSGNKTLHKMYPELRIAHWTPTDFALSFGGWVLYLAGYEFMFRGMLLFGCYYAFGLWPAVTINLALYTALHLPKGIKETIGAIPFGALICYVTIESQSILPAIILHSIQAISCEIACTIRNPEMKISLKS